MWKLVYYVKDIEKEIVIQNAPKGVCQWQKALLSESTHKLGTLKVEKLT